MEGYAVSLGFITIIIILNLRTAAFQAYCAIWVRRSNFRHQASPRVSPRESTQRRKVELWARNVRKFCLNAEFYVTFRDRLHAVKLQHGTDGFTSPPKEGVLRIFLALKIRGLRPVANPRTRVPKASTLSLDHRSRCVVGWVRPDVSNGHNDFTFQVQVCLNCKGLSWWNLVYSHSVSRFVHFLSFWKSHDVSANGFFSLPVWKGVESP